MHNPTPLQVFAEDVGTKGSAQYCTTEQHEVIERESYGTIGMAVVRIWEPELLGHGEIFNADTVRTWALTKERWVRDNTDSMSVFSEKCDCETAHT